MVFFVLEGVLVFGLAGYLNFVFGSEGVFCIPIDLVLEKFFIDMVFMLDHGIIWNCSNPHMSLQKKKKSTSKLNLKTRAKSQPDLIAHDGRNMHDSYPVDQPPSGRKAMYHGHSGGNGGGRSARSGSSTARSQSSAMISARSDNGRGGGGASRSRNFTRGERPPMALAR